MNTDISDLLEWCQQDIDILNQLPPEQQATLGADQRHGWKRRLEHYMEHEDELQDRRFQSTT